MKKEKFLKKLDQIIDIIHLASCFLAMLPVIAILTFWIWLWIIPSEILGVFTIFFVSVTAIIYAFWGLSGWVAIEVDKKIRKL